MTTKQPSALLAYDAIVRFEEAGDEGAGAVAVVSRALQGRFTNVELVPRSDAGGQVVIGIRLASDARAAAAVLRREEFEEEPGKFREFWGARAELRRFRDGSVVESVVWAAAENDVGSLWKESICERAVRYALSVHCPTQTAKDNARLYVGNEAARALTGGDATAKCLATLERLSAAIRALNEKLPIPVATVTACCGAARGTQFSSLIRSEDKALSGSSNDGSSPSPICTPVECYVVLAHSAKWPRQLEPHRAAKLAVLTRLAKLVRRDATLAGELRFAGVCAAAGASSLLESPRLRVFVGGFCFLLRLAPPKVRPLEGNLGVEETPRLAHRAMAHHARVRALSSKFRCYAWSMRLLTRWMDAQLFSEAIPLEALELIVAAVYAPALSNARHDDGAPPGSALRGFLLALHLISTFDFKSDALYVALSLSDDDEAHIEVVAARASLASARRRQTPNVAIVAAADYYDDDDDEEDEEEDSFSSTSYACAEKAVFSAVRAAAAETLEATDAALLGGAPEGDTPTSTWLCRTFGASHGAGNVARTAFHATLRVDRGFVRRGAMEDDLLRREPSLAAPRRLAAPAFANLAGKKRKQGGYEHPRVLGGHPAARYVAQLRLKFSTWAVFFHNASEPLEIGVVWRPAKFVARPYAPSDSAMAVHVAAHDEEGDQLLLPNVLELLDGFKSIGGDLVKKIDLHD